MKIVAVIFVIIGLLVTVWAIYNLAQVPKSFPLVDHNDLRKEAIKLGIETSSAYFNMSVVLLGFLWVAFVVEKQKSLKLGSSAEIALFVMGNIFLILSMVFHYEWKEKLTYAYWDLPLNPDKMPDIFHKHFNEVNRMQLVYFILSLLVIVCLIAGTRIRTKGED